MVLAKTFTFHFYFFLDGAVIRWTLLIPAAVNKTLLESCRHWVEGGDVGLGFNVVGVSCGNQPETPGSGQMGQCLLLLSGK